MTGETAGDVGARPRWSWLAATGLSMIAAGLLLMFLAGAIFGFEITGGLFLLVPAVIAAAAAFLVIRFGSWTKIVGAVVGFLIGGLFSFTAVSLVAPASFFDFVPGMLVLPGGLIALIAGIAAARAQRRGRFSDRTTGVERAWIRGLTYVVGAGVIVSGILTATGRSSADESKAGISIVAKEFKWNDIAFSAAGASTVYIRNDDPFQHTFTIDALGINQTLTPGDEFLITIPARSGSYIFYCKPHTTNAKKPKIPPKKGSDDGDMAARLIVT